MDIYSFTIPDNKVIMTASVEKIISIYVNKDLASYRKQGKTYELEFIDSNSREKFKSDLETLDLFNK